jgi:hypothetical protein
MATIFFHWTGVWRCAPKDTFETVVSTDLPTRVEHEVRVLTEGAVSSRVMRAIAPAPQLGTVRGLAPVRRGGTPRFAHFWF